MKKILALLLVLVMALSLVACGTEQPVETNAPEAPGTEYTVAMVTAYGPTNCAERTAFFKAVYDGHRDFVSIAVCGGKDGVITGAFPPCGICRQVMREFCGDDFILYLVDEKGFEAHTLAEILPFSFSAGKHMQA